MASHFTMSLRPSSTIIGFFIGFNFGAAAKRIKEKRAKSQLYLHSSFMITVCVCVLGETARQGRTEQQSQSSSLRTEPTTLSCDHQMLSLETLSTLPQTNKQAEFLSSFAAIKTPEAVFSKHAQADEEHLRPQTHAQLKAIGKQEKPIKL